MFGTTIARLYLVVLPPKTRAKRTRDRRRGCSTVVALFRSISLTSINSTSLVEKFRSDSDHNFDKAEQFHDEALNGKRMRSAMRRMRRLSRPRLLRFKPLAERAPPSIRLQAAIAQERAAHQTTHEEKWGLNLFRLIATWLIEAHIAGRSDRPEFAEMRDMAKDVTDAIQRGEPFRGYRDEPEKKARLQTLLAALLRP